MAVVSIVVIAAIFSSSAQQSEDLIGLPVGQREFLSQITIAQEKAADAPNSLAFNELLELRNSQLTEISSVEDWSGTVLGVQQVQGKGALSVDIGGITLLAGIHLTYGLDTRIQRSQSTVYNELLSLRRGDRVQFSGQFSVYNGSLVEMNYTDSGAVLAPEFLFQFSRISAP